ncbi:MAG: adenylate/guanylate cyclase domain-containing protein [Balneolaceae bacterium]|nr:adenylate/guanylate cyclase domain-containing protein [Balneolaceae bacterium]
MLSPKTKRNISRILPFGFIWVFMDLFFLVNTLSLTGGTENQAQEAAISYTAPVLIFASLAVFIVGILVGTIEIVLLEKRFSNYSFLGKIFTKFLIYSSVLFGIILITYPIAAGIELNRSPFHPDVLYKLGQFLGSFVFLNTALQLSFELVVSLIYAAISENLGHNVIKNFFIGRYHTPKVETRIFMFLDMKNSTTIAEELGHVRYFDFLRKYYDTLSEAIIRHHGEVYQYVGDEIVLTWELEKGTHQNNWLACYCDMKNTMNALKNDFQADFGISPDFRAGVHVGEVTTGEIGALKKEIVFTGDVLNTAARLQSLGKEYQTDLIFSEELHQTLNARHSYSIQHLGPLMLRGKSSETGLFTLN